MTKEEFNKKVQEEIKNYLPEEYASARVLIREIVNCNEQKRTALQIVKEGDNMAPNVYIDEFFDNYKKAEDFDRILKEIADVATNAERPDIDINRLTNYDLMKDRLTIELVDKNMNSERLKELAHTKHGDFAATYRIIISETAEGRSTALVNNSVVKQWGVTVEQIHQDALKADLLREPELYKMQDIIADIMGSEFAGFGFPEEREGNLLKKDPEDIEIDSKDMLVLTNKNRTNGAGLLLQEEILKKVSDIIGGDYYVLPSSIHETIILPAEGDIELDMLEEMVKEVNREEVAPQEILSNEVQYYDRDNAMLVNARIHENPVKNFDRGNDHLFATGKRLKNKGLEL